MQRTEGQMHDPGERKFLFYKFLVLLWLLLSVLLFCHFAYAIMLFAPSPQVSKHVCLSIPFIKKATQKGSSKEHCMCIKENKTFHRKAFSATLQASTDLFDTCESMAAVRLLHN